MIKQPEKDGTLLWGPILDLKIGSRKQGNLQLEGLIFLLKKLKLGRYK
jgi:hypothetical protein